jgi:hypothetical protein
MKAPSRCTRMLKVRLFLSLGNSDFLLRDATRYVFEDSAAHRVAVFRPCTVDEQESSVGKVVCEVVGDREVGDEVDGIFEDIARHEIPRAAVNRDEWWDFIVGGESLARGREVTWADRLDPRVIIRTEVLPRAARDALSGLEAELLTFGTRISKLLRWRLGLRGSPGLISRRQHLDAWSIDGAVSWLPLPFTLGVRLEVLHPQVLNSDEKRFVDDAIVERISLEEPVAHELLHEAWINSASLPRSSFIMAIAAAEIGLKSFIASRIPNAAWLMENLPSPPIVKILDEFVPEIVTESIPKDILEILKVGVTLRNDLVHKGRANLSAERLTRTLQAVRRLLYLLDTFSGHEWARELSS